MHRHPAVVCDLDYTLCDPQSRNTWTDPDFSNDRLNIEVKELLDRHRALGHHVILLTARVGSAMREGTVKWLKEKGVDYHLLIMKAMDMSKNLEDAAQHKLRVYDTQLKDRYDVKLVLDDDSEILDGFMKRGVPIKRVTL